MNFLTSVLNTKVVVLSRNIGTNPWHPFVLLIPMSITVARTVCLLSIEITYVNPISILEHHSKCVILQVLIHSAMDWNSNFSLKSSVVIAGKVEMTSSLGKISSFWPFSFIFGDILTDKATPLYKRRRANVYFYFIVNNPMIYGVYARLFCREKAEFCRARRDFSQTARIRIQLELTNFPDNAQWSKCGYLILARESKLW